jgi:hypothetical protein
MRGSQSSGALLTKTNKSLNKSNPNTMSSKTITQNVDVLVNTAPAGLGRKNILSPPKSRSGTANIGTVRTLSPIAKNKTSNTTQTILDKESQGGPDNYNDVDYDDIRIKLETLQNSK